MLIFIDKFVYKIDQLYKLVAFLLFCIKIQFIGYFLFCFISKIKSWILLPKINHLKENNTINYKEICLI